MKWIGKTLLAPNMKGIHRGCKFKNFPKKQLEKTYVTAFLVLFIKQEQVQVQLHKYNKNSACLQILSTTVLKHPTVQALKISAG